MDRSPTPKPRWLRFITLVFKILITIACLWYVSTKLDFNALAAALGRADWLFGVFAIIAFILSKTLASFRLNIYFKNLGLRITEKENLKLFWLGMFYNLFLPGSITGDAYKVIVLSRRFSFPYRKLTAAVLLDRFSGLLGLGSLLAVYGAACLHQPLYIAALVIAALLAILAFYLVVRRYFPDFFVSFWQTFILGLLVQVLMVVCIYGVILSLRIENDLTAYVFIFLVAAVAGVLPLTIGGGLGIREFVFYHGALYFSLDEQTAVVISLLFYCITLVTSLFGAIYIFRPVFASPEEKS